MHMNTDFDFVVAAAFALALIVSYEQPRIFVKHRY